jgi:hypothetical protein
MNALREIRRFCGYAVLIDINTLTGNAQNHAVQSIADSSPIFILHGKIPANTTGC